MPTSLRKNKRRTTSVAKDPGFAYTLGKGFQILESFTPERQILGNKDLWRLTNLNRSTISRVTKTLCDLGYLIPANGSGKYELGLAVLSLAYPRLLNLPIRRIAHPLMQELANAVHGVVNLGMRDRLALVWIDSCRKFEMQVRPEIGARRGFETTVSQVFLAGLREQERSSLLAQIKAQSSLDAVAIRARVRNLAREIQLNGFRYVDVPELNAIASPIQISPDGDMAVVDCVVEKSAMSKENMLLDVAPRFKRMIDSIQHALGVRALRSY